MTVIDERVRRRGTRTWCLSENDISSARAASVPYNVFEVKLAKDDEMPPGLAQAEAKSVMELAAKFSKFLTGAAAFNPVPILPYCAAHPELSSFFQTSTRLDMMLYFSQNRTGSTMKNLASSTASN